MTPSRRRMLVAGALLAAACATEPKRPAPPPGPPQCPRYDRALGHTVQVDCAGKESDGDGIDDAADLCPGTPAISRKFVDQSGCATPDGDGDQVADGIDDCPSVPGAPPVGCPVKDTDGDGIPDHLDSCPDQGEDLEGIEDQDGCPDSPDLAVLVRKDAILVQQPVHFLGGSAMLLPDSKDLLDRIATLLAAHKERIDRVRVVGHADPAEVAGKKAQALSRTRARVVAHYLVARGLDQAKLDTQSLGAKRPLGRGRRDRDREKNQRVELLVTILAEEGGAPAIVATPPDQPPDAPGTSKDVEQYKESDDWDKEFLDADWDTKLMKK